MFECALKTSFKACACIPWNYPQLPNTPLCDYKGAICFDAAMSNESLWRLDDGCSRSCPSDCEGLTAVAIENSTPLEAEVICRRGAMSDVAKMIRTWTRENGRWFEADCYERIESISVVTVEYAIKTVPTWYTDISMTNFRWMSVIGKREYDFIK